MNSDKKKVVVPSILNEYAKDLVELQREYISIEAKPLDNASSDNPLYVKQSKFIGNPFFPIDT